VEISRCVIASENARSLVFDRSAAEHKKLTERIDRNLLDATPAKKLAKRLA
jgi:hypothetical protein